MPRSKLNQISTLLLSLLLPITIYAQTPIYLTNMQIQPGASSSHIFFTLTQKTSGRVRYLPDPSRLIIEFAHTYKDFAIGNDAWQQANIISLSADADTIGNLRFTIYLRHPVTWHTQFLPNSTLQLDILSKRNNQNMTIPAGKTLKTAILQDLPTLSQQRVYTIVIDAGHGGKDSGAIGERGTQEKNVVLSIAKKLAYKINQETTIHAVLTRSGDYFVPLRGRLDLARKGKADVFIAIHADSYFIENKKGASIYALSQRGASSEAARWLARRDNYSELGGVELNTLPDRDPILRSVLVDLAQTATIRDSMRLGNQVLDALEATVPLHSSQVERAPFVVLKSPDIPSILVETGFISNPSEETRLTDPAYQDNLATALKHGITRYIQKYATQGE